MFVLQSLERANSSQVFLTSDNHLNEKLIEISHPAKIKKRTDIIMKKYDNMYKLTEAIKKKYNFK